MKVMKIASLLALLQGVAAADVNATSCPETDKIDKPFSGVTINVLGRSFGHDYFMSKVAEWEQLTGATVNVPLAATSGTELNELTAEDLDTGANYYDGYIATNQNVPTLASQVDPDTNKTFIMQLDELAKNSPTLDWPGIDSIFREYLCLYDNHIYTIPFDGDQFLLFYRRDLQEKDGWDVPKTWDELVDVAEQYQGQDLDGDGEEDYAICQPNQGDMAFYSLYAPLLGLLQTHNEEHEEVKSQIFPKRHGAFMNLEPEGLSPLVDNAAMRKVMELMKKIHELGQDEDLDLCCSTKDEGAEKNSGHGLFRTGKCAFYFSFPSVGTNSIVETGMNLFNETEYVYQHGRMGTAPLPGWAEYLDRDTDTLMPCTKEECPSSIESSDGSLLNTVSWYANGGMGAVINGRVSDLKQRATFSLFSFFSSELSTTSAGMPYNPFRFPKHFQLDDYIEAGWDEVDAKLYLDAIQQSFELPNSVMDLRVPYALESSEDKRGFFRAYVHHFNEFYRRTQNATNDEEEMDDVMESVISDLDQEILDWITTHDIRVPSSPTYWTGEIEEVYRRSFGIPLRAEPEVENEVPVSVAISVLSVGAVLIIFSGVYVMRSKRHSVFKFIKGLFNPISSSFFELTMLIFDISGDVLAFVLVVRKDENIGDAFKITYGGFVAFALGISLIAIVVSITRIRHELGLIKKKPDQTNNEDFDNQIKTFRTASFSSGAMSSGAMSSGVMSSGAIESAKELSEVNGSGDEVMSAGRSAGRGDSGYDEFLEIINTKDGEAPQELSTNDTQGESPVEEEKKVDTIQVESPVEVDEKFLDEEKEPKRKLERRRSSFSDFVIGLNKDDGMSEEEKKLAFAEAFTNLLLLVFEDLPMAIMNMIYIMHFSGGNVKFSVIYMLSFAGGLVLLGFKFSKLREVEAIEGVVDRSLLLMGVR